MKAKPRKPREEVQSHVQPMPGRGGTLMPRGIYIRRKIDAQKLEKRAIAVRVASEYIQDFSAVLLDAGSTAELVAEELFARRRFLSVLTNNMGAYAAFTQARVRIRKTKHARDDESDEAFEGGLSGNELLITGGRYVDTFESLLGEGALATLRSFTPNVTVVGISGLSHPEGVFCHGAEESNVKKLLWEKPADLMLVTADWTKIGKRDAQQFGSFSGIGERPKRIVVVTCNPPKSTGGKDLEIFDQQLSLLQKAGVHVDRLKNPE